MSAIKTTQIDGDLAVGRNVATGGDVTIQGGGHVKGNLRVDGWLDAPNIKQPGMGLFASAETLAETYPHPRNGWWALVGDTLPAAVYRAWHGEWVATGETGGEPSVELDSLQDGLNDLYESMETLGNSVNAHGFHLLAGTQTIRKGTLNVRAVGGQFSPLSFTGLEAGKKYVILLYNSSADFNIRLHSESGTPLYTVSPGKPMSITAFADEQGRIAFNLSAEGSTIYPTLYWLIGEYNEKFDEYATKEQVKPLENLGKDILDTQFMAARDGFMTSVDPTATDVPLSFPWVRPVDGQLMESDEKLTYTIPAATKEHAGVMTAADKQQQENLSEAVSELQRQIDESTGAIIPELDIGFSVELI